MTPLLEVRDLSATVDGHDVLRGVDLRILPGELHVLMGPNGSGKSSFALTLFGHPNYQVTGGSAHFSGTSILEKKPHERARLGMFLSFQHPVAIPGVSVANLTRVARKHFSHEAHVNVKIFRQTINGLLDQLHLPRTFLDRSVNDGFSGGEKKLSEILQMGALSPRFIVLDEPDSGLDIDAMKRIADMINEQRAPDRGILMITHYQRLLDYLKPDAVHVFRDGRIVRSGTAALAEELERQGYEATNGNETP